MKNKSPAFQFYPKDFLTDDKVIAMSSECRGLYITLICIDWLNDGILPGAILKLSGFEWLSHDGAMRSDSQKIEQTLLNCFEPHPEKDGYVTNKRLQKERQRQIEHQIERSEAGRKGAAKRWVQPSISHIENNGSAIAEPMAKNNSSSSSSSSSSSPNKNIYIPSEEKIAEPLAEPLAEPSIQEQKPERPKKPKSPPGFRPGTRAMGPCKHVYLTQEEYDILCKDFTKDRVHRKIISLDADIENGVPKYVKYSNHKACLLKWFAMDGGN